MANDFKDTMNLPQTEFPMRAGLAQNEPKRLAQWESMNLYERLLEKNSGNASYILHDGPPYANGPIHIGHAFNKILKDIVIKYHSMRGFYAPYVPGWDCHGQPIEHMVEKTLGPAKMAAISKPDLRRLCREWAEKYVGIQREGFKRLGILGEWDNPYLTYLPHYEAGIVQVFKTMYLNGSIYRGRKPIHWCYHDHTALAEAELEYSDEVSTSIYVAFTIDEPKDSKLREALKNKSEIFSAQILIWTTTPWTLPANTATTLSADASYVLLCLQGDNPNFANKQLLVAEELVENVALATGAKAHSLVKIQGSDEIWRATGAELLGLVYRHPILDGLTGCVVTGAHVELTTGTGAVHTAPGHGQEDFQMGLEYNLPLLMPVDANGVFDAGGGPFASMNVKDANPLIVNWLRERGVLVGEVEITHSYPHCWRCKQPVIFRATDQWFVSMEDNDLRELALAEIGNLQWYPNWSVNRMRAMIEGRPDWCISRQRAWGVPIPVFKCSKCGSTVANEQTFDAVIELFAKEGADAWFTHSPTDYLPNQLACEVCGCTDLEPEKDILDVWWESGVSHTSVLKNRDYLQFPADLYLEGSDQHRGWFQSSLLTSVGAYHCAPYKAVMSCGFIVDAQGRKQSKSLGNVVDPEAVIANYGADVLRLWVGSIDSSQDVGIDDEILKRISEAYRRFRNIFRFLLSNLYDFATEDLVTWDNLLVQDRWALVRLRQVMKVVDDAYQANRFHLVYHALYDYVITELSAVYLDALKDRLYSEAPDSPARRSAQSVLCNILEVLVRQLAPILAFTCDEVLEYYPAGLSGNKADAILLAGWPEDSDFVPAIPDCVSESLLDGFAVVLQLRDAVTRELEEARAKHVIGKSQEAKVVVSLPQSELALLKDIPLSTLEELLIVSEVELLMNTNQDAVKDSPAEQISVTVLPADGQKCPRCWNYRNLGGNPDYPDLCDRCADVLAKFEAGRV